MKFILIILTTLVIIHLYILWDIILSGWENVEIELDAEELGDDLYKGLHNKRDDVK
tara:strand:+ start:410 stop:577 length:168 start_codon:yes stop_codon:yes gene_type:complete